MARKTDDINQQSFTPEEVKKGLHLDLIKHLLDYNEKSKDHYNEIMITTDGYCTIIEWVNLPYNKDWGGHYEYINEDAGEHVMVEYRFPDGSYVDIEPGTEKEVLEDWLEDNPGWEKTSYGVWHNKLEEEKN